jgi:hypothetical protein
MISDEKTDGPVTVLFEPELMDRDSVSDLN